jgi:hypothetical protein
MVVFKATSAKVFGLKDNKHYYLGLFDCPKKAYEAYCNKALELHGDFANLG